MMPKMILSLNCFQTFRSKGRMSYQISEIFIFHELIDALSLQEEFAGVVARVEGLSPSGMLRDGRGIRRLRLARRRGGPALSVVEGSRGCCARRSVSPLPSLPPFLSAEIGAGADDLLKYLLSHPMSKASTICARLPRMFLAGSNGGGWRGRLN